MFEAFSYDNIYLTAIFQDVSQHILKMAVKYILS